jgi:hypothetical protein
MDFNKHADKRRPDDMQTVQSKNFKPCAGYLGFVPQVISVYIYVYIYTYTYIYTCTYTQTKSVTLP